MKDEEMAKEYCNHLQSEMLAYTPENPRQQRTVSLLDVEDAFLAGLKAGRPQWHDLQKDPKGSPKEDKYYLIVTKLNNYYISKFRGTCWIGKCNAYVSEDMVIAWCEIPTFDKE